MMYNGFPFPTLLEIMNMKKSTVGGLSYALKHNVEEKSDYGWHALQVVYLLLEYIENNMNDDDTIADIIKTNTDVEESIRNMDLVELGLSCRSFNMLKRSGVNTIGDIEKLTSKQLMNVRNFGKHSYDEVIGILKKYGITLQDEKELDAIRAKHIDELNLSSRSYNCLIRAGLYTIGDIEKLSLNELKRLRNFGKHSYDEVIGILKEYGITLSRKRGNE